VKWITFLRQQLHCNNRERSMQPADVTAVIWALPITANNVRKEVRQMDRETRIVQITPELLLRLKRARAAAFVIVVGFFTMFVLFAPEGDPQVASRPAVQASR
jgi:hypothetical protein